MPAMVARKSKRKRNKSVVVAPPMKRHEQPPPTKAKLFGDEEAMKAKMRKALIKPQYNVFNSYKDTGCAQKIAKSAIFEHLTFAVIMLNALWIAVDTDYNDAQLLVDADLVFQVVDNAFCFYFSAELLIRFIAFRRFRYCLRDFWFVFDTALVGAMVAETWVITVVVLAVQRSSAASGFGNFSVLRVARLVKMARMARMARLLRMVPELVVILRAMGVALRSVTFFMLLTVIIVYVFAVAFCEITKGERVGLTYFPTVPDAMNTLLLSGMLPLYAVLVNDIAMDNPLYWFVIMAFILLGAVTVMNMLIGVLVEVVRTVASTEKESITVSHVTRQLREVMHEFKHPEMPKGVTSKRASTKELILELETEEEGRMAKADFTQFLQSVDVGLIIQDVGVDVLGLLDMTDMIYEEYDKDGKGLTFESFIDVVLNMRGTNPSTVKDVKAQIRVMKSHIKESAQSLRQNIAEDMESLRMELMEQLFEIRKSVGSDAGSDLGGADSLGTLMSLGQASEGEDEDDEDDGSPRARLLASERSVESQENDSFRPGDLE